MYYVYGGWAQGINLNEYPPAVAYLFGKQTYDESTHEMQLCDEMLRRRWEGKYQIDAYALTPEDQKPIEEVFDFLLRPWASEPSRALGGSQ